MRWLSKSCNVYSIHPLQVRDFPWSLRLVNRIPGHQRRVEVEDPSQVIFHSNHFLVTGLLVLGSAGLWHGRGRRRHFRSDTDLAGFADIRSSEDVPLQCFRSICSIGRRGYWLPAPAPRRVMVQRVVVLGRADAFLIRSRERRAYGFAEAMSELRRWHVHVWTPIPDGRWRVGHARLNGTPASWGLRDR